MKILILLSFALLLSICSMAKEPLTGKISLKIVDKQQNFSAGTFIELLNAKDSSLVRYATTGNDGAIDFTELAPGSYVVYIPQIGSKSYTAFTLKISNPEELYDITLTCPMPNEVTVVAQGRNLFPKRVAKIG
jgi:hypothetical protein